MGSEKAHREKIETAIDAWARAHEVQLREYYERDLANLTPPRVDVQIAKRFAKIWRVDIDGAGTPGGRSIVAFIDLGTGDVFMPAGTKGPAKHARGNVLDVHAGLGSTTAHGVAYLR